MENFLTKLNWLLRLLLVKAWKQLVRFTGSPLTVKLSVFLFESINYQRGIMLVTYALNRFTGSQSDRILEFYISSLLIVVLCWKGGGGGGTVKLIRSYNVSELATRYEALQAPRPSPSRASRRAAMHRSPRNAINTSRDRTAVLIKTSNLGKAAVLWLQT